MILTSDFDCRRLGYDGTDIQNSLEKLLWRHSMASAHEGEGYSMLFQGLSTDTADTLLRRR